MCGIAGLMVADGQMPDAAVLDCLAGALRHRGPDGQGRHVSGNLGLIQTRLAVIDLETGDQPLYGSDGTALVANAEIYNYVELRAADPEGTYRTQSDCESPLRLYQRHGLEFARTLRGMYAIALHDPHRRWLVLARDPFGIKPLYYAESSRGFVFASEPHAILATGLVAPRIQAARRTELLQLQFTTGRATPIEGIERVLPGETLVVSGGRIVERRRIAALPNDAPAPATEDEALGQFDRVLEDSVNVHQRADVPYGMFLSGGVDSSAVLAMMARLNERPVVAFTVGFPGTAAHDEREHAREVARAFRAEHVEVAFTEEDFWTLLPAVASALDDPAADYAVLPTYKLGATARGRVKVILSGEGGDEIFAGYGRYRSVMRPWWRGGRTLRARGIFDGMGVLRQENAAWRDGVASAEIMETKDGRTPLQIAQATDCADWLPNDLLNKLDRCLMVHGVEGRTPFLDPVVADFAFRLPDALKVRKGKGKWILRRWLEMHAPVAEPFARKRGFTVPVGEWISARGRALGPLVASQPGVAEACRPDAVRRLFGSSGKRVGFAAWTLLFYALWHQRHVLGLMAAGDVFETLAGTERGSMNDKIRRRA